MKWHFIFLPHLLFLMLMKCHIIFRWNWLNCSTIELKEKFWNSTLLQFYKKRTEKDKIPVFQKHAILIYSFLGSTYICEQLFSKIKYVKPKARNWLMMNILIIHFIQKLIKKQTWLSKKNKQCQVSLWIQL